LKTITVNKVNCITSARRRLASKVVAMSILAAATAVPEVARASPYIGVTAGFADSDLEGPYSLPNVPLYNPVSGQMVPTWDDWVEEATAAGIDYLAPDQRGYMPISNAGDPHHMVDLVAALQNRGVADRLKLAIFDDNAASWCAQWNAANGRGYGYAEPFDISDSANWVYIWDYNYKVFYESVPDANRFKIDGRPVIIIWSLSPTFVANPSGNASQALAYVRQQAQATFGFDPYIIVSSDWIVHDPSSANSVDAVEAWFIPSQAPYSYSVDTYDGTTIGVAVAAFQSQVSPSHGDTLTNGLLATYQGGSELTLLEGFTDWEEQCALFRVSNLDADGGALTYDQTGYDFPSQRIGIIRDFSSAPFQADLKEEAEAADSFGGGNAGNTPNFYRNGDIDIEPTSDLRAGYDVANVASGEWLEWERVPIQGSGVHFTVRVASASAGGLLHFVVDGQSYAAVAVPDTGGPQNWTTIDAGTFAFPTPVYHNVRLVFDAGGFNVNYWQLATDLGFSTGFETGDPQPTWTSTVDDGIQGNPLNVMDSTCAVTNDVAHFESSLKVSGTVEGDAAASARSECKVLDLSSQPVLLGPTSSLSYFVNPQNDNGRFVAIDLHFTDGTWLEQASTVDQNGASTNAGAGHGGSIPIGVFSLVTTSLSSLAGKSVDRIDVEFDRSAATGDYLAYVDDVAIAAPGAAIADAGAEDAGAEDAGADASPSPGSDAGAMGAPKPSGAAGCGCVEGGRPESGGYALALAAASCLLAFRRRGARP
jgi:Domain of unknown function (DUF5010)/DUF5010 C-terminal domain